MLLKVLNSIIAGVFISFGATAYLILQDPFFGGVIFSVGILLVSNFWDMLYTRVIPLSVFKYYTVKDVVICLTGNIIGGFLYSFVISLTRLNGKISAKIYELVNLKMSDSIVSLLLMGILCGVVIGYAVFLSRRFEQQKGLCAFYYVMLITVFVICGFDHVVANSFYYGFYLINYGFTPNLLSDMCIVLVGNTLGGIFVGYTEKYRTKFSSFSYENTNSNNDATLSE